MQVLFPQYMAQQDWFTQLWVAVFLVAFLFGPFISIYCLVRFLRDLRRIANSVERLSAVGQRFNRELDELPADKPDGYRAPVLNSMFGR